MTDLTRLHERILDAVRDLVDLDDRGRIDDPWWDALNRVRDAGRELRAIEADVCTYHGGCSSPADPNRDDGRCEYHAPSTRRTA